MASKNHERAIEAAKEYRRESQHGDVVRAEQVRLTIERLVGHWKNGRFVIPQDVADVMRGNRQA